MIINNTFKENKTTQLTSRCLNTDYTAKVTVLYVHCYFLCVNITLQWNNSSIEVTLKSSLVSPTIKILEKIES